MNREEDGSRTAAVDSVFGGPVRTLIYNDGYEEALGRPARAPSKKPSPVKSCSRSAGPWNERRRHLAWSSPFACRWNPNLSPRRRRHTGPALSQVILFAISESGDPESFIDAFDAGFDAHLVKPVSLFDFERALMPFDGDGDRRED